MLYALIILQCALSAPACTPENSDLIVIKRGLDGDTCGAAAAYLSGQVGEFRQSARCRLERAAPPTPPEN